jgi:excisionase family DNA binding protein
MELEDIKKPEPVYSTKEVALKMGWSYAFVWRLVKSGKLKALNVAKTGSKPIFRFRAEDIQEYLDSISSTPFNPQNLNE